ncbi:MAG: tRNA (cytidine(34)-2'-O)-methyltransferase [Bacillota bacterium]
MNHIVLFEPEIPQNTGNIMRTAVSMNMKLHLVEPLGFFLDDKALARSSVQYEKGFDYEVHDSIEDFMKDRQGRFVFLSRYGRKTPPEIDLSSTDDDLYLVFGSESEGIPKPLLKEHMDSVIRIPMHATMRSLNLASSVAIVAYEALRQQNFEGLSKSEVIKGPDFLSRH